QPPAQTEGGREGNGSHRMPVQVDDRLRRNGLTVVPLDGQQVEKGRQAMGEGHVHHRPPHGHHPSPAPLGLRGPGRSTGSHNRQPVLHGSSPPPFTVRRTLSSLPLTPSCSHFVPSLHASDVLVPDPGEGAGPPRRLRTTSRSLGVSRYAPVCSRRSSSASRKSASKKGEAH